MRLSRGAGGSGREAEVFSASQLFAFSVSFVCFFFLFFPFFALEVSARCSGGMGTCPGVEHADVDDADELCACVDDSTTCVAEDEDGGDESIMMLGANVSNTIDELD